MMFSFSYRNAESCVGTCCKTSFDEKTKKKMSKIDCIKFWIDLEKWKYHLISHSVTKRL